MNGFCVQMRCPACVLCFKLVIALPDCPPVLIVRMPDLWAVPAPAAAAYKPAGKNACAAFTFFLRKPFFQLFLNPVKQLRADYRRVASFYIILRHFPLIGLFLFRQKIYGVDLLQKGIAFILFILQDAAYRTGCPGLFPARRGNLFFCQRLCHRMRGAPLQKHPVNPAYCLSLLFIDYKAAVLTPVIPEKPFKRDGCFAVCKPLPLSPGAVLGNAAAFFLCQRGHDCKQQLTPAVKGPDIFLFKIAFDLMLFQLSDGGQAVYGISCKPRNTFGNNQVNLSRKGILHHPVKAFAFFCITAGNSFVRIYSHKFPVTPIPDILGIILCLRLIAALLLLMVCGNACISSCPALSDTAAVPVLRLIQAFCSRYCDYAFCHRFCLPHLSFLHLPIFKRALTAFLLTACPEAAGISPAGMHRF